MHGGSFKIPTSCGCQAAVLIGVRNDVLTTMGAIKLSIARRQGGRCRGAKHLWTSVVPPWLRTGLLKQIRTRAVHAQDRRQVHRLRESSIRLR